VSNGIGERPWWSSSQPNPFITLCKMLKNNSWKSNTCSWKNKQT